MKRKYVVPVTILLLNAFLFTAHAEPTKRRGLNEFSGLYMQRFMKYQYDNGYDYDVRVREPGEPVPLGDYLVVFDTAGTMEVYSDDLSISQIIMHFITIGADNAESEKDFCSCMMAFSALEMDAADEYFLSLGAKINGGPSDAIEKTFDLWEKEMPFSYNDEYWQDIYGSEDSVLVYSGNYDYYLKYNSTDLNGERKEYYTLTAKEHE